MVDFMEVYGNNYCLVCVPPIRATEIRADVDLPRNIFICEIQRGNSTGRDPRTHRAFTHHICPYHNVVVVWE